MKNKWLIFLILIIVIGICFGIYFLTKKDNDKNNYTSSKISSSQNNLNNNNVDYNNIETTTVNIIQNSVDIEEIQKQEELISSFSTKIYTMDSARQNNISITCSTLNGTIITDGSTFSFCNTIGQSTSSKGYQEADIFDKDGNKKKGLGGGNCQVSTTLYNAVLKIPSLVVTEKHEHSNKVPYIEYGKDAAVAYGSYDLKFRNDTGFDIKVIASNTDNSVDISLYKIY